MDSLFSRGAIRRPALGAIAAGGVVAIFVALALPACIAASHDVVELWVSSTDAPLVFQQFMLRVNHIPSARYYGDFLPVVLATVTAPLRELAAIIHFEVPQSFYILLFRLSQLGCAGLALFGLYRLTTRLSSPWMGCVAVAINATMLEFIENTALLHPDIWQWMAELFSLGALVVAHNRYRATGRLSVLSLVLAAFWAGAATASKINGVFLAPAVGLVLLSPLLLRRAEVSLGAAVAEIARAAALFLIVFVATTIAFWPILVTHPLAELGFFKGVAGNFEAIGISRAIKLLAWEKLSDVISSRMMGPFVPALYITATIITFVRWLRHPGMPSDPLNILHVFTILTMTHYMIIFRDTFNVHNSERYILLSEVVALIVVLVTGHRLLRERPRGLGAAMIALVAGWQGAQAAGLAGVSGLAPLYTVMHKNAFLRYASVDIEEPLAAKLRAAYVYDEPARAYLLRPDLTQAEWEEANAIRRTREGPATLFSPNYATLPFIRRFWHVEDWAGFRIRHWVLANIPEGNSILIEYYMNLEDPQICGCDPNYLGNRKILQNRQLIYVTDDYVKDFNPDFILTRRKTIETHLLQAFPEYEQMAVVNGTATNLLDDLEAAPASDKHPPSVIFVLRKRPPPH